MRRSLSLGGFSGTGKSTVGRAVAARAGVPFVDLDVALAQRWGAIAHQFARDGEAVFRLREAALLKEVVSGPVSVIATGGGTWVSSENRTALAVTRRVVLRAPLAELQRRIGPADPERPLWDSDVASRLQARAAAYADADLQVETAGRDPSDIAAQIAAWWDEADSAPGGG